MPIRRLKSLHRTLNRHSNRKRFVETLAAAAAAAAAAVAGTVDKSRRTGGSKSTYPDHSCVSFDIDNSHIVHVGWLVIPAGFAAEFGVDAVGAVAGMQLGISSCRTVAPDAWL